MSKTTLSYPEKILDSKFENGKVYYLVEWTKKSGGDVTWEPENHIDHRTDLIADYQKNKEMCDLFFQSNLKNKKQKVYGIARVSSTRQVAFTQGETSLVTQEEQIRQKCNEKGWHLVEVVHEIRSSFKIQKLQGLKYILNTIGHNGIIAVYDISRFARDFVGAINFLETTMKERNLTLYSVMEDVAYYGSSGRHVVRNLLSTAAFHSEILSEKIKHSVNMRKNKGHVFGPAPFGFKAEFNAERVRKFIKDKDEQKIIDFVVKEYEKELKTTKKRDVNFKTISDKLNKKNVLIRNKKPSAIFARGIVKKYHK